MRLILLSAVVLILVSVLTIVVVLRRGGRGGEDLLASQMRTVAGPQPVRPATSLGSTFSADAVDDETWRRIGELAQSGRRLQAIELLKTTAGCRLVEAKAVVDQLTRPDVAAGHPPRARRPTQFPPGWDVAPDRPAEPTPPDAHRLVREVRDLAYQGRSADAIQLLQDRAGMSGPEAEAAIERLTEPAPD